MTFLPARLRRLTASVLLLALAVGLTAATGDRKFATSTTLGKEVRTMVQLLEGAHYNRDAVRSADYRNVISDYMDSLDGQRLFFLSPDQVDFETRYTRNLYWNVSKLGNIDAAYDIYGVYEQRVTSRVNWIFDALNRDIDLTTNEVYHIDRRKQDRSPDLAAADALWEQRLKYELISEMLNKKELDDAKQAVRKRYERMLKNLLDIEGGDLAELFLSTVARLYDPHSSYLSSDTFEDFGIQMKLELVGIGAVLGIEDDYCVIKEIVAGGPADLAGQLRPNDRIISVAQAGGEPVEVIGMKLRKVVNLIRGQKNTLVKLVVQPSEAVDSSTRREVIITRDVVKLNSARAHASIHQVPGADGSSVPLGVISLPSFYGAAGSEESGEEQTSATQDVAKLIEQLKQAGVQGMVLDLRRNGGGFLSEAVQLTGLFIKQGPVVQVKNYAGEIQVDHDDSAIIAYEGPLAVLADRFSASASEIVAGALQNYGRAIVIGDSSTHGKGTVQSLVELRQWVQQASRMPVKTGATKLTVQKYYLPSGASTQVKGVVPDIVLPSIEDYLPIGESDLPRALVWDEIPASYFDGEPIEAKVLDQLRQHSTERQGQLAEFTYLLRNVEWFKHRQEQKLVSLNLEQRREQQEQAAAFRKEMTELKAQLAQHNFAEEEIRLSPKPNPLLKAPPRIEGDEEDELELSTDDREEAVILDVSLREALRVVQDAIKLAQNRQYWVSNRAPLTARVERKG